MLSRKITYNRNVKATTNTEILYGVEGLLRDFKKYVVYISFEKFVTIV